jgi:hypothetical protein
VEEVMERVEKGAEMVEDVLEMVGKGLEMVEEELNTVAEGLEIMKKWLEVVEKGLEMVDEVMEIVERGGGGRCAVNGGKGARDGGNWRKNLMGIVLNPPNMHRLAVKNH